MEHFECENVPIGRTTVYRQLNKLTESGKVRKYTIDGIPGACFEYVDNAENCPTHIHLKCEGCGELIHLQCDMLHEIQHHMDDRYAFQINTTKTVFYGKCAHCH